MSQSHMEGPKPLLIEFGVHQRLESCVRFSLFSRTVLQMQVKSERTFQSLEQRKQLTNMKIMEGELTHLF